MKTPSAVREWRTGVAGSVGLTPTMGFLHKGHMALVRRSVEECEQSVASIFVNPTQFGPHEDFERYPRDEARDLALLQEAGVDAVYLPSVQAMYPDGYATYVNVEGLTDGKEGDSRPGHFRGVATVVTKLLTTVRPNRAYFGKKDAQQLRVIRRMARDLDLGADIVGCETVREEDGLAMSSRNAYLTGEGREAAGVLYRGLKAAAALYGAGERSAGRLREAVRLEVAGEPLAELDYVSVAESGAMGEVGGEVSGKVVVSVAVRFGAVRLIDNIELGGESGGETDDAMGGAPKGL